MKRPDFEPAKAPGARPLDDGCIAVAATVGAEPRVWTPQAVLAVRVALATARPLLVTGEPGVGKSSLARSAATVGGWPLHEQVVGSRTQARDLLWRFDAVRRLADAQAGDSGGRNTSLRHRRDTEYLRPAALWCAFDPAAAARLAGKREPAPAELSVVLVDEIDKADPDVPNDLLDVLDRGRFEVDDLPRPLVVEGGRERVLMVITSNRERELPAAFLRRCVALHLPDPTPEWLATVGAQRFPDAPRELLCDIAGRVKELRDALADDPGRKPGTAEYLDAVQAALELGIATDSPAWTELAQATLWKRGTPLPAG